MGDEIEDEEGMSPIRVGRKSVSNLDSKHTPPQVSTTPRSTNLHTVTDTFASRRGSSSNASNRCTG